MIGGDILTGQEQFMEVFGGLTVGSVAQLILAGVFLFAVYKKFRDYLIKKHDADAEKDRKFDDVLKAVEKYPEYRKQSLEIQKSLERDIAELRKAQEDNNRRLAKMEETDNRRERNRLRDILIQNYRHFTNTTTNPSQSWTKMESESFWELFHDYEDAGGDGYVHTVVQPAMERLLVTDNESTPGVM